MFINAHTHTVTNADVNLVNVFPENDLPPLSKANKISCGIHPWFIKNYAVKDILNKLELFCQRKEISAIGECGLDKNTSNINLQKEVFLLQVELSEKYKLPMVIHSVKTYSDLLEIYKLNNCKQPWIIHGFTGSKEVAKHFTKKNIFISLGNYLLNQPQKAKDLLNQIDLNFVLFETDDKDLGIELIYETAAKYLNCLVTELEGRIECNFNRIF